MLLFFFLQQNMIQDLIWQDQSMSVVYYFMIFHHRQVGFGGISPTYQALFSIVVIGNIFTSDRR